MAWERSRASTPRLDVRGSVGSTNTVMLTEAQAAPSEWPHLSALVSDDQQQGKGRLGREWVASPGSALAISVLVRPVGGLDPSRVSWLPLIAGLAMARAVDAVLARPRAELKWPNDVLIEGHKVSGVLAEIGAGFVVVGAGVNLELAVEDLPVPTATSVRIAGAASGLEDREALADAVLATYLSEFGALTDAYLDSGSDADASGVHRAVSDRCTTIGRQVRVELPDGSDLVGTAVDIDPSGRIEVARASDGAVQAVAAGDVTHLRY